MSVYIYKAKTTKGRLEKGNIEAPNQYKAIEALQGRGLIVISIKEAEELLRFHRRARKKRFKLRLKYEDLGSLARQLATLLDAGVPLLKSLEIVKAQTEVRSLYNALESVMRDVEAGEHLSSAISKQRRVFPNFWVHLIATGETSGQLPFVLGQIAQHMESTASLQRKIVSSLIYPIILSFAAAAALTVFITIVVPMFSQLYSYFGAELPFLTNFVLNISLKIKQFFPLIIFILILLVIGIMRFKITERGRIFFDNLKIRLPIFNLLFYNLTLYRFSEGLAMLLKSGVPILYSLEVVAKATANRIYENIILQAKDKVRDGESLGASLEAFSGQFPPFVVNMIKIGEESGNLPTMLAHVSNFYQEKVDTVIARLPYIIEPIIILTIGGVIATIVISMFLPIFGLSTAVAM